MDSPSRDWRVQWRGERSLRWERIAQKLLRDEPGGAAIVCELLIKGLLKPGAVIEVKPGGVVEWPDEKDMK